VTVVVIDVIAVVAYNHWVNELKKVGDLPQAQQKILLTVLRIGKPAFFTSEVHKKISDDMTGRSVGAVCAIKAGGGCA